MPDEAFPFHCVINSILTQKIKLHTIKWYKNILVAVIWNIIKQKENM